LINLYDYADSPKTGFDRDQIGSICEIIADQQVVSAVRMAHSKLPRSV